MGNAPSSDKDGIRSHSPNAYNLEPSPDPSRRQLSTSPTPGPGRPHHSMKFKKRSLDLPDISIGADAQPLAIPKQSAARNDRSRRRKQKENEALSRQQSMLSSHYLPSYPQLHVPPPSVNNNASFVRPILQNDNRESPIEEEYQRKIVRSTLPVPLAVLEAPAPEQSTDDIDVPIVWTAGGESVFVFHTVENADVQVPMKRDGDRFIATIPFAPGTHHILFFVDGAFRIAADMPKTVNSQGTLTNYVSVGLSAPPPPALDPTAVQAPPSLPRSHSFWSSSSAGGMSAGLKSAKPEAEWTNEIPGELAEAAAEEEAYLSTYHANASAKATQIGRTQIVTGFDPLPQPKQPSVPTLPRHFEKQILNTGSTGNVVNTKEMRRGRHGHGQQSPGHRVENITSPNQEQSTHRILPVTTASGTDLSVFGSGPMEGRTRPVSTVEENAVIVDDNSVLPVPSHVVLNHLSTSSIRHGVLAVANTVRYKNKFLTTIYYKPTI